jgi:hypothetical protein
VIDIVPLDKKIPILGPPRTGRKTQYPWQNAEVRDSFLIPGRNAASNWTQKTGFEFVTRAVGEARRGRHADRGYFEAVGMVTYY